MENGDSSFGLDHSSARQPALGRNSLDVAALGDKSLNSPTVDSNFLGGERPESQRFEVDEQTLINQFNGNWIWRACHALLDHPQQSGAGWMAERLGVAIADVTVALEGLQLLALTPMGEKLNVTSGRPLVVPKTNLPRNQVLQQHRLVAAQITNRMSATTPCNGINYFLMGSPAVFNRLLEMAMSELLAIDDESDKGADCQLFGVSLSVVQLSSSESAKNIYSNRMRNEESL